MISDMNNKNNIKNNNKNNNNNKNPTIKKKSAPKCYNCNKIGCFSVSTAGAPLCGRCAREYMNGL